MIPSFNIISFADSQLLYVIFNGVAMICDQTAFIWSVASLAGIIQIISMSTQATLQLGANPASILIKGWINILISFVLAILLTNPALKGTVTTENLLSGQQTTIANVPLVISIVPYVASTMADSMGGVVETAFQGNNSQAPYLASRGNGFLSPLKTLLSARNAAGKLPGIESQINSVISQCLDSSSGVDYALVSSLVMNAGNTAAEGASSAQSIQISNSSSGATSLGALLYQASLNNTSFVVDFPMGTNVGADALSCSTAALQVAANINSSLLSSAFSASVSGAISNADTANQRSYSLDSLNNIYLGIRQSSSVLNTLSMGTDQANTEMLNLLFQGLVKDNLDCLRSDGVNKVQCLASMEMRKATEQANIDNASAGQLALQFAGQFGNYMLALIIGLSPIMIIFMMFRGVNAGKSVVIAVHMIVWPYLVTNVGGSLINGMIYYNVGNLIANLSQGGMINQMNAAEVYRSFSMQIGAASALMATLPVLMTTIFALSESAAIVSLGGKMSGADHFDERSLAPQLMSNSALVKGGEMMSASFQLGSGAINKMTGAFDGVASSQTFGANAREVSLSTVNAMQQSEQYSSGEREMKDWREAFKSGDYSRLGVGTEIGQEVKSSFESNLRAQQSSDQSLSRSMDSGKSVNENVGGEIGLGLDGLNLGFKAGIQGQHSKTDQSADQVSKKEAIQEADSLSDATAQVSRHLGRGEEGIEAAHSLERSSNLIKEFSNISSQTESFTSASQTSLKNASHFVAESNNIGSQELAFHSANNARYMQFLDESRVASEFVDQSRFRRYKDESYKDMENDIIASASNPYAKNAILSHRAMVRMAQDESLSDQDRLSAQGYLAKEGQVLSGLYYKNQTSQPRSFNLNRVQPYAKSNNDLLHRSESAGRAVYKESGKDNLSSLGRNLENTSHDLKSNSVIEGERFHKNMDLQKKNLTEIVESELKGFN